jgi:hypothetical protein
MATKKEKKAEETEDTPKKRGPGRPKLSEEEKAARRTERERLGKRGPGRPRKKAAPEPSDNSRTEEIVTEIKVLMKAQARLLKELA